MAVGDITSATIRISKHYNNEYYIGAWFYDKTFYVDLDGEIMEGFMETPNTKRMDQAKSKDNWKFDPVTKIIELLQVNKAYTITGFLANPSEIHTWKTTTLNGNLTNIGTTITVVSTASFSSQGMLLIENEYIYYTGKTATTFTSCQRGFDNTTAAAYSDTTTVYNRTEGAVCKLATLEFLKSHGGTVEIKYRNKTFEVFITKFLWKDTKTENTCGTSEPAEFGIVINAFEGILV